MRQINLVRSGNFLGPATHTDDEYLIGMGVHVPFDDEGLALLRKHWGTQGVVFTIVEDIGSKFESQYRRVEELAIAAGRYMERHGLEELDSLALFEVIQRLSSSKNGP